MKKEKAIEINNKVVDFIEKKDDYDSSHSNLVSFYASIFDSLYEAEQDLARVFVLYCSVNAVMINRLNRIEPAKKELKSFGMLGCQYEGQVINPSEAEQALDVYISELEAVMEKLEEFYK